MNNIIGKIISMTKLFPKPLISSIFSPLVMTGILLASLSSVKASDAITSLQDHLDTNRLASAIQDLNEGKKDFCFIPLNFSENEKIFLTKLEVKLPEEVLFGKTFIFQGNISFLEDAKKASDSVFNQVKIGLNYFFGEYTNANKIAKEYGIIEGSELLSRIMLEYSEKLLNQMNAAQPDQEKIDFLFMSIKAFKKNDIFLNFLRWHYDGDGSHHPGPADLNFAGVFTGTPTVFAEMNEANRATLTARIAKDQLSPDSSNEASSNVTQEALIEQLIQYRDKHLKNSVAYANLNKEIEQLKILISSRNQDAERILKRLSQRMSLHDFIKENQLIERVVQPQQHEVALFTMKGVKPALHSEPHFDVPRIFFGLRSYQSMRGEKASMNLTTDNISDIRKS